MCWPVEHIVYFYLNLFLVKCEYNVPVLVKIGHCINANISGDSLVGSLTKLHRKFLLHVFGTVCQLNTMFVFI